MLLNRRGFIVGAAGAATGIALSSRSGLSAESVQLRAMWWGSNDRSKRTLAVAKLFEEKNPDIRIVGESLSGDGYWTKLATQMAGRAIADIFQLEPSTISDYSKRGACMALDPFISS
ncbi:extracellular solute-binding protein, partial [Sinorhizobium meliloti]|uniref:extracellular solute-binding protein n=1 Tax=Rhizobium meliloti TaxID=382 RepID=UPI000FDA3DCD